MIDIRTWIPGVFVFDVLLHTLYIHIDLGGDREVDWLYNESERAHEVCCSVDQKKTLKSSLALLISKQRNQAIQQ